MKKIVLSLCMMFVSTSALAAHSGSTWQEILADYSLRVEIPLQGELGDLGIFNTCAAGDSFNTVNPIKVCTEYKFRPPKGDVDSLGGYDCVKTGFVTGSVSRLRSTPECMDPPLRESEYGTPCKNLKQHPYTIPLTHNIKVYQANRDADIHFFTKSYTVPACY
jgi:hypothetical protein